LHPEEVEVIAEGNRKFYRLRRRDKVVIEQYGNFGRELVKAAKADVATSQLVGGMTLNQRFTQQLAEKYGDAPKGSSIEVQTDGEPLRRFKDASTSNDNPYNTNRARFYREYNNPRRTKPARANSLTPGDIKLENKFAVLVDSPLLDEDERLDRRDRALAREERHADQEVRFRTLPQRFDERLLQQEAGYVEQHLKVNKARDDLDNFTANQANAGRLHKAKILHELEDITIKHNELVSDQPIREAQRRERLVDLQVKEIKHRQDAAVALKEARNRQAKLDLEELNMQKQTLVADEIVVKYESTKLKHQVDESAAKYKLMGEAKNGALRVDLEHRELLGRKEVFDEADVNKSIEKVRSTKVFSSKKRHDPYDDYLLDRATSRNPTRAQVNELYARGYRPAGRKGAEHHTVPGAVPWNDIVPCTCKVLQHAVGHSPLPNPCARDVLSVPPLEQLHKWFCSKAHGDKRTEDWMVVKIGEHYEPLAWFLKSKYFFSQRDPRVMIPAMVIDARNWMLSRGYTMESYLDYDILVNAIRAAYEPDPLELFMRQHMKDSEVLDGVAHINKSAVGESQTGLFHNPMGHTSLLNKLHLTSTCDVTHSIRKDKI